MIAFILQKLHNNILNILTYVLESAHILSTCWACSDGFGTKNSELQAKIHTLKQMINDRLFHYKSYATKF